MSGVARPGGSSTTRGRLLALAPLAAKQSLLTSNVFQPFLGQNTTQYFPGVSPSGASANAWGGFMSGTGGTLFGKSIGLYGNGNNGGGGSGGSNLQLPAFDGFGNSFSQLTG